MPQFIGVLEKIGCDLVIESKDESVSAKGAAYMYLHYLYSVPGLEDDMSDRRTWCDIVEFLQFQKEEGRG